jgi:hypothetical protein
MSSTCTGTTLTGEKCKNKCKGTSNVCFIHGPTEDCSICLEAIPNSRRTRYDSCTHVFHKHCIDQWKERGGTACPNCRSQSVTRNYKVNLTIEPVGVDVTMVTPDIQRITRMFGINDIELSNFITEIEFDVEDENTVRQFLLDIGFPVTTLPPESTQ